MYTWTEPNESPCLPHRFRLWVHGRDSDTGQESWELDTVLEGVDTTRLGDISQQRYQSFFMVMFTHCCLGRYQRYRPPAPRELEIVETLYSLVVSWGPAPCVQVRL